MLVLITNKRGQVINKKHDLILKQIKAKSTLYMTLISYYLFKTLEITKYFWFLSNQFLFKIVTFLLTCFKYFLPK